MKLNSYLLELLPLLREPLLLVGELLLEGEQLVVLSLEGVDLLLQFYKRKSFKRKSFKRNALNLFKTSQHRRKFVKWCSLIKLAYNPHLQ